MQALFLYFYILGYFEANVTVKSDFVRVDVETQDGIQRDLCVQGWHS